MEITEMETETEVTIMETGMGMVEVMETEMALLAELLLVGMAMEMAVAQDVSPRRVSQ